MAYKLQINGREVSREEFHAGDPKGESGGVPMVNGAYSDSNPLRSVSMGCHPDQAGLMNDTMHQHGITGVTWDKSGKCFITSRRDRARAMPIYGNMVGLDLVHDDSGSYGDG